MDGTNFAFEISLLFDKGLEKGFKNFTCLINITVILYTTLCTMYYSTF